MSDINDDGSVNVDDLLSVLNAWGLSSSDADIAPTPCSDGVVNVDDLLLIINNWGPMRLIARVSKPELEPIRCSHPRR